MSRNILDISKGEIELRLSGNDGVSLERLSLPNVGDFALGGPLFGVSTSEGWVDGKPSNLQSMKFSGDQER